MRLVTAMTRVLPPCQKSEQLQPSFWMLAVRCLADLVCEAGFTLVAPLAQVGGGGASGGSGCHSSLVHGAVLALLLQAHQLPHLLQHTPAATSVKTTCRLMPCSCTGMPALHPLAMALQDWQKDSSFLDSLSRR